MDKHVTIKVPRDEELKDIGIKQFYHKVKKEEKLGKLYALFDTLNSRVRMNRQLCEHKAGCQVAHTRCQRQGLHCLGNHGGMSQLGRDTAIQEFWAGSSCILIATDL